jgi:hypothetical protein
MTSEELQALKATSGYRLTVILPGDLPQGHLEEWIELTATRNNSDDEADVVTRRLPLQGSILGRLTVYGKDVTSFGTIQAGLIDASRGYDGFVTIKINDPETELSVREIVAEPSYIEAHFEPFTEANAEGLYRLRVHIPPSDKAASFRGNKQGKLRLTFDHPRISELELGVDFIVLSSPQRRQDKSRALTSAE